MHAFFIFFLCFFLISFVVPVLGLTKILGFDFLEVYYLATIKWIDDSLFLAVGKEDGGGEVWAKLTFRLLVGFLKLVLAVIRIFIFFIHTLPKALGIIFRGLFAKPKHSVGVDHHTGSNWWWATKRAATKRKEDFLAKKEAAASLKKEAALKATREDPLPEDCEDFSDLVATPVPKRPVAVAT